MGCIGLATACAGFAGWAGCVRLLLAAEVWLALAYCCCGAGDGFLACSAAGGERLLMLLDVLELGLSAAGPFGADFWSEKIPAAQNASIRLALVLPYRT